MWLTVLHNHSRNQSYHYLSSYLFRTSSAPNPADVTFIFYTLMAKFIGWSLVTTFSFSKDYGNIAELVTATVFHRELESVSEQNCGSTFILSSTPSIGTQMHIALYMLLDMTTDTGGV